MKYSYAETRELKLGLSYKDIDTVLHHEYNTMPFHILTRAEFNDGVLQLLHESTNRIEFYERLGQLRDIKLKELEDLYGRVACHVMGTRAFGPEHGHQKAVQAALLFGQRSFKHLIEFFMLYFPEIKEESSYGQLLFPPPAAGTNHLPPPAKVFRYDHVSMSPQTDSPPLSPPSIGGRLPSADKEDPPEFLHSTRPRRSSRLATQPTKVYNERKTRNKIQKKRPKRHADPTQKIGRARKL